MDQSIKVRVISKDSCQQIGDILEVKADTVVGELTGQPMHEIVGKNDNAKYIIQKYCEVI